MTRRAPATFFFFSLLSLGLGGCDSASVYEDCKKPEKEGTGEERCVPSTFAQEDELARQAAGFVSIGIERVPNTVVNVNGALTTTDPGGFYRYADTPFRYDVSTVIEDQVIAFHRAAVRFIDLAVEHDGTPRAYVGKVKLALGDLPRPGNELAFFVDGENIAGISGTAGDLSVLTRTFENDHARIHVVEYPKDQGIAGAVAKGSAVVTVRANDTVSVPIVVIPIVERKTVTFAANPAPPSDFAIEDIELLLDFGTRTNRTVVRTMKIGEKLDLPVMEGANWLARTKAKRADGAIASIGLRPFAPGDSVDLAFYAPPTAVGSEGDVLYATSAQGTGVFEHVLVPVDPASGGGKTIHLFSAMFDAKVPDLGVFGLSRARGEYRWTVRVFPDFPFVESMSGADNRLYRSSSTSAPRTIVLP